MTYLEYLRRVYGRASTRVYPWLCYVAQDELAACVPADYSEVSEHYHRLASTIRAHLLGHTFLPDMLREQRPGWPYAGADGKAIRLAWLAEQIAQAEAEAGACTPT